MTRLPRLPFVLLSSVLVMACSAEPEGEASDAVATESGATSSDPRDTFAKFAGTWQVSSRSEVGDSLPGYVLTATADSTGWSITFPDRPPIPVHIVDASGDLAVIQTEPYESVLRPGVRVTVLFVTRVTGDRSSGRLLAMYDVAGANALLRGVTEGTRQP